jgi:hypothetical protein
MGGGWLWLREEEEEEDPRCAGASLSFLFPGDDERRRNDHQSVQHSPSE